MSQSLACPYARAGAPRVLIVSENQSVPSDRRVWTISRSLQRAGYEVVVVCPQGDERERAANEQAPFEVRDGVQIRRFPVRFAAHGALGYLGEYAAAFWRIWRLTRRLAREAPFDVIHACNPPDFLLMAAWPARRGGARLIFDHHDLTPELFLTKFGRRRSVLHRSTLLLERLTFAMSNVVVSTNESYANVAKRRGRKRGDDVFVVRNAPDLSRMTAAAPAPELKRGRRFLIGYVGVMGPQDGLDHALSALALLRRSRQDWHAILAGEGEARPELERMTRDLGLQDVVEFAGWLNDEQIATLLSTSDLCLAPEPSSPLNDVSTMVKIAEYMARSRPVVAYGLPESELTAGAAAAYARPNQVASYADKISELLDDDDRRERMGVEGRRRVEGTLSWAHSEASLLAAYRRALGLRPQRRRTEGARHADVAPAGSPSA